MYGRRFVSRCSKQRVAIYSNEGSVWAWMCSSKDCRNRMLEKHCLIPAAGHVAAGMQGWESFHQLPIITSNTQVHLHSHCCAQIYNNISSQVWEGLSKPACGCLSACLAANHMGCFRRFTSSPQKTALSSCFTKNDACDHHLGVKQGWHFYHGGK